MKIVILTFFLAISLDVLSQTNNMDENMIEISAGLNQIKEENLHTKVNGGLVYNLRYTHERTKNNLSSFNLSFQYSRLRTAFENSSRSMNIQIAGNYSYLFELTHNPHLSYFTGPHLSVKYRLSYYPNWDDSHLYWADDISLGWSNRLKYQLTENTALSVDLNASMFSMYARPELNRDYKIDDVSISGILKNMNSNFEFGTINRAFRLYFHAEYRIRVSQMISEAFTYSFDFERMVANEGNSFSSIQHRLGLKLYF